MRPISPNTGAKEIELAKEQPEYQVLPVAVYRDVGMNSPLLVSRWTLSDEERLAIAEGADIFVSMMTFGNPPMPLGVQVGPQHFQLEGRQLDIPENPYKRDGLWYFADETEQENGPFASRQEANDKLGEYCRHLEGRA